jgi:catechol 2,3-dioxygenase-like lactoylglutathione lyase family enzyme
MRPFTSLGHFNLKVADLDASIAFYAKLGFPEFLRLTQADGRTWIVYLRITDELYIELLPGGVGRAGDQQAAGLKHLCLTWWRRSSAPTVPAAPCCYERRGAA